MYCVCVCGGGGGGGVRGGGLVNPHEVVHYECVFSSKKAPKYVNHSKKHIARPVNVRRKGKNLWSDL